MKPLVLLATLLTLSAGATAQAEGPWRTVKDVARDIATRGAEYFDDGDWERAREHFHRAYEIVRAPTLALMEARALVKLGRLAEATDAYSRAATAVPDESNEPYRRAATEARGELAELSPRVPSIRVLFPDDEPRPVVRVDGYPLVGSTSVAVNPGTHVITIARPGVPESWQSVTIGEGEQRAIAIERSSIDPGSGAHSSRALSPLMWTAFGVGGAGLATGIVSGAFALGKKAKLDQACDGPACPPGYEDDMRDYRSWRTASIVGYLVGVAGIAGGAVILASKPRASGNATRIRATVSYSGPSVFLEGAF
jgi:hypothetical protein